MRPWHLGALGPFLLLLMSCMEIDARPAVTARAERDLDCDPQEVYVNEIGACTYHAEGCGKQATYIVHPKAQDSVSCCPPIGCYATMDGGVTQLSSASRAGPRSGDPGSCDSLPDDDAQLYRRGSELVTPHLEKANQSVGDGGAADEELRAGVACLERVLLLAPAHFRAMWLRARALQTLGEHARAVGAYAAAYKARPGNTDVGREYVLELLATKSFPEAVGVADRVAREHPADAALLTNLALAHLLNADPQRASDTIDHALSLDPTSDEAKALKERIADVVSGRRKQPQSLDDVGRSGG